MIDQRVSTWAACSPDRVALHCPTAARSSEREAWTFGQLESCVRDHVTRLNGLVSAGAPVAIVMGPYGASVAALIAALRTFRPAVLLPASAGQAQLEVLAALGAARAILHVAAGSSAHWRMLSGDRSERETPSEYPDDAAIVQLTSGSMGPSRFAVRSRQAVATEIDSVGAALGLKSTDHVMCTSSPSHSYALFGALLVPLSNGVPVSLSAGPEDLTALAAPTRPTILFGLAATYQALMVRQDTDSLASLRFMFSAGAALPHGLSDRFVARFGRPIRQDYGTTETGTICLDVDNTSVPNGVGRPLSHVGVQLKRAQENSSSGTQDAEVLVRSAAVATGYLEAGGLQACVDEDGWFHTRDVGALDGQGYLHIGRRLRDAVEVAGHPVHPEVLERLVTELEGIRECVVVFPPREQGRPAVRVAVVGVSLNKREIAEALLRIHPELDGHIEVVLLPALPRSPAGKILQSALLEHSAVPGSNR